jgi:acyl-CoA thioesterase FadM
VSDTWDFVLAHVGIDYRSQLTQDDREVVVRCWLASYGRSSVRTREEIRTDAGVLSANAESVIVPRDPRALTARRLSDEERAVLDEELARDAG